MEELSIFPRSKAFELLDTFLLQAKTRNLETKKYRQRIGDFSISAGFGQGQVGRVPWFGFLADGQKPQQGIYPVCLYYKKHDLMIVSYGISETTPPQLQWGYCSHGKKTISDELERRGISVSYASQRGIIYGNSIVKKCIESASTIKSENNEKFAEFYSNIFEILDEYTDVLAQDTENPAPDKHQKTSHNQMPIPLPLTPIAPPPSIPPSTYTLHDILADGSFLPLATLERMLARLRSKKNIILQGPPGTGKTWLAKRLAWALIGEKATAQVQSMQFHATLSYEDFVRGWRPSGQGQLKLLDGPFLECVEQAHAAPDVPHVMVIEEINRGNPAQIFGELLTLLEADKRRPEEQLRLCYQEDGECRCLHLPENLYIIGTMNIADRSLAIVDFALRRRFAFFDLKPEFGTAWQNWMHTHAHLPQEFLTKLAANMDACNQLIAEDTSLGSQYAIGHSYVTCDYAPGEPVTQWLEAIVEAEILPLLREYWFDAPQKVVEAKQLITQGLL